MSRSSLYTKITDQEKWMRSVGYSESDIRRASQQTYEKLMMEESYFQNQQTRYLSEEERLRHKVIDLETKIKEQAETIEHYKFEVQELVARLPQDEEE